MSHPDRLFLSFTRLQDTRWIRVRLHEMARRAEQVEQ